MAKTPTEAKMKKMAEMNYSAIARKVASQKKAGKEFVENGQGVVPESVWTTLKGKVKKGKK